MSSADRDARIAALLQACPRCYTHRVFVVFDPTGDADLLECTDCATQFRRNNAEAELRAALSREEEAKKDAERVNWLEQAVASADHEGGRCVVVIGAWYSSDTPSPDGYSVNVGELHVDPNEWANLREAIDCARSVSLSENG